MKLLEVDGENIYLDDEDYLFITSFYNLKRSGNYIYCSVKPTYKKMGLYDKLQLHKLLMNPDKTGRSINVDHRDGNENNYQKLNLRVCKHSENMKNRKPNKTYAEKTPSSTYKGVYFDKGLWRASLASDNDYIWLGRFTSELAAANCYNYWAKANHGEFAQLNILDVGEVMDRDEWESYKKSKTKTSKYRGVSLVDGRWIAQLCHNSKNMNIGSFNTEIEAALAYNQKAIEVKGDKAKLNDIGIHKKNSR